MSVLRGLIGVLVGLAVTVGFVQFLELMLANALAAAAAAVRKRGPLEAPAAGETL